MSVCFNVEIAGHIAHVQFKRAAEMNTMIPAFWNEFPQVIRDIDENAKARVIVISSTGKHFSAGMDLAVFTSGDGVGGEAAKHRETGRVRANLRNEVLRLQETFNVLDNARIPVLAAVQGGCVGGAVDLTSACDMRYCTRDAFFVIQEINIGMTADVGTFPRLCHLIPQGWVRELAYTGRRLYADKAKEIGLVNEVYEDHAALMKGVMETAREIASRSPLAVYGSKVMINYARDHAVKDSLDYIATWQAGMFQPKDMIEAFAAKAEKREGRFDDLYPLKKSM
ncbi:MAG: crotonase/enoyl-CoA hydratase family protein [Alphaproteobacteria bacterium]|nr:crotonase/enoyl-CoA hydratase family protein [Alphaproteobacteria bacterium]